MVRRLLYTQKTRSPILLGPMTCGGRSNLSGGVEPQPGAGVAGGVAQGAQSIAQLSQLSLGSQIAFPQIGGGVGVGGSGGVGAAGAIEKSNCGVTFMFVSVSVA